VSSLPFLSSVIFFSSIFVLLLAEAPYA
jgi:hypothetical protein